MELIIATTGLLISVVSAAFVYVQIILAAKTTRSALLNDLVGVLHFDPETREVLDLIYRDALSFEVGLPSLQGSILSRPDGKQVIDAVEMLLARLQMVGHLFYLGALKRADLRGIRFETIMVGRSSAVRAYLQFLNTQFQELSGVVHDHFAYFKKLYLAFEYDGSQRESFALCLFHLPRDVKE
jgi:hypothetical protein